MMVGEEVSERKRERQNGEKLCEEMMEKGKKT
jgi:hypothetical protein